MTTKEYNTAVDEWGNRLYRMIYQNLRDEDESKNLVQDAFEVLWMNKGDVENEQVKSFLFTTGYRKMIDLIRRNDRFRKIMGEMNVETTHDTSSALHARQMLELAFEKLETKFKNVILLRDQEGYSYEEIADITGQSLAQVRTNLFRGRSKMKSIIGQLEGYSTL
ncbi:MAG: RNA polymerase sigma factor (sigma-70 family) [Bacteroidia bacterium]|jgi:RNA polymerase sigma factor (sigma-70 family)